MPLGRDNTASPLRAAIYARYSSDGQSNTSIEDQARVRQKPISSEGCQIVGVDEDRVLSATSQLRPSGEKPRKIINGTLAGDLYSKLESMLPDYASRHLEGAISGDLSEAEDICVAAPNEWRGMIAMAAYYAGTPNPAYQEIIRAVWNHDHASLLSEACGNGGTRLIRRMFIAAKFEHPFTGPVTIYRGTSGASPKCASKGLSWMISRDVACWFG